MTKSPAVARVGRPYHIWKKACW